MPIIASHCQPGNWRYNAEPYEPSSPWPADTYVQWGSKGIVLGAQGNYRTAFFEAFPKEPKTFIRGEGTTVAQAEAAAFAKLQKHLSCLGHEFERRSYTNGAGVCRHCLLFASDVFAPSTCCHVCGVPTNYSQGYGRDTPEETGQSFWYCEAHEFERLRNGHWAPFDDFRFTVEELEKQGVRAPAKPNWLANDHTASPSD